MASFRAIETISDVLIDLLRVSHERLNEGENGGLHRSLDFKVYQGKDFRSEGGDGVSTGVSLFLYRTVVNGTSRTPSGRRLPSGETQRSKLPLDLHYLLTVWADSASTQHQIAGWVMRTLETTPILPKGVLNNVNPEVFRADETVEIILNDLSNEDLFRIWDVLGEPYRLSIPYLVRNVRIESEETVPGEGVVERRIVDVFQHENGNTKTTGSG
ncbi:MAG: DUF4255 domain-containing protein [Salinibacter sp.]|uniref:DUF4255 domain-containing protein n=1 Tax=Salinibacter sp. TaxID=2065818 RepID=UPI002FC39F50